MRNRSKKVLTLIILGVYLIANFFQSMIYSGNKVYAARNNSWESQINYKNIVAIIVNDDLYNGINNIRSELEWYVEKYIQWDDRNNRYTAISNSQALVFPVNTDNFSAKNITQLLENIYFGWIEWETSRFVWLILIWDIPLPVVNQNGYIYPTIYPYVDFEEQKFIWDEDSQYFVYNNNPNWQAEVWHWIIDFGDNIQEYKDYFHKLESYRDDPESFVDKAIWYEDFIGNTKYFNDTSLNAYLNNFLFAEDLWYHRYSDLMIKVLQWQRNQEMSDFVSEFNETFPGSQPEELTEALAALANSNTDMNTPTMQIKAVVDNGYLDKYTALFGQKYLKTISDNVETANRWIETLSWSSGAQHYIDALDTVYKMVELNDDIVLRSKSSMEPLMIMVNNALEEAVDEKVEKEKYWLNEVLPLTYLKYEWKKRFLWKCVWSIYEAYENYAFGTNARYLESMEQTSTYRWTYRNYESIDWLTIQSIQSWYTRNGYSTWVVPSTDLDIDLNKKSIWWSYDIFAQQVDANRWYNYNNSLSEYKIYSWNKTAKKENWGINCVNRFLWMCIKRRWAISDHDWSWCDLVSENGDQWGCEDPVEYGLRIRWWASPLNLDPWAGWSFVWKSWYSYTGAISPIFDIWWSTALQSPEYESNSFEWLNEYSYLTIRRFSPEVPWKPRFYSANPLKKAPDTYWFGYDYSMDYEVKFANEIPVINSDWDIVRRINIGTKTGSDVDYFDKYTSNAIVQWNIIKIKNTYAWWEASCWWAWEVYTYKTLDSRVKNDSVNEAEVNGEEYSIFNDLRSPSRQFYEELVMYLDSVSGSVNVIVWTGNDTLLWLLSEIKTDIDNLTWRIQTILDTNISIAETMSSGAITNLANNWANAFSSTIASWLLTKIQDAQDEVISLSGFIDLWDSLFDGVIGYLDEEYNSFQVNGWDLIFLNQWKNNIYNTIVDILDNYQGLKPIIFRAKNRYDEIGYLLNTEDVVDNLSGKKEHLASLLGWSWCQLKYRELCEAIDKLIDNYSEYADIINIEKDGINNIKMPEFDEDGEPTWDTYEIRDIFDKLGNSVVFDTLSSIWRLIWTIWAIWASLVLPWVWVWIGPAVLMSQHQDADPLEILYNSIYSIPSTGNAELTWVIPWMNATTSDRPIDSPRYLTFKGIAGDKVTFIYPDIYKAEIFSGNSSDGMLKLKKPEDIAKAIKEYLRDVVKQYNKLLINQLSWYNQYYNQNSAAFDKLAQIDPLATPASDARPYARFNENYLVTELERRIRSSSYFQTDELAQSDPILFIANLIYYQNITWQEKTISATIQGDYDNQRTDFDINEKISYLMDNYLVADNNRWQYLTPNYRDSWYEVAYINSDGNDYLVYEVTPPNTEIQNAASSFVNPTSTQDDMGQLEEELLNECNIPMDWWVLLFQVTDTGFATPWFDALKCRWDKIKEKPFEFKITFPFTWDTWMNFWDNMYDIFELDEYKEIGLTYKDQLTFLDTDEINNNVISNMDLSNPWDATKLQEILSYTIITTDKTNISADNPSGTIDISSEKALWSVQFYIVAMWNNKVKLEDRDSTLSPNITVWQDWFSTWSVRFEPYNWRTLHFDIANPIEWYNILMFYMCLPGTQNLENCVRESIKFDVVPWEIKNISVQPEYNLVLDWASIPFKVKWTDQFGNNVWELVAQKFLTSVTSGSVSLNGVTATGIRFSDFKKANFNLNATGENLDWKTITIQVSGYINWEPGIKDSTWVKVVKWRIDVYSGNTKLSSGASVITWISMKLPDRDIYYTIDSFNLNQINTGTLPKVQLKLVDKNWTLININWKATVKTKKWRLSPWKISQKVVTRNINWNVTDVDQYSFTKTSYFELSGWIVTVYLLPNFSAWEDVLNISMPGVDDINIPIYIHTASPSIIKLSADSEVLNKNSSTNANIKVFDNWNNLVDEDVHIVLDSSNINRLSFSKPRINTINSWSMDFEIYSHDKWGMNHVYAQIDNNIVPLNKQSPGILSVTVQEKMLPEEKLNVMYLNLFGDDWGNQRWYMSDNEKYPESLINKSDKLITVTTQLLDYENIKQFPVVIDKYLKVQNIESKDTTLTLESWFLFDIDSIWEINISSNTFKLEEADISEDVIDMYISNQMSGSDKGKNVLFYIPEQEDSILTGNEARNSAIIINGEEVFSLRNLTIDPDLDIKLTDKKIAWYQVREVFFGDAFAGKMLFAVDSNEAINIRLNSSSPEYWIWQTWINWSSNEYWWWFYLLSSELPKASFGYKSIQDSDDINLWIWFTADFKNITNFGWGMPVWEATLPFSSELLINIWDPLLKRIDWNRSAKIYDASWNVVKDTEFDLWIWEVIYSEPGKEILKVMNIDFNNDDLEDIIVIFKDWTIKILKNYWWTNPFQNLWALMILADRINDVSVWDVDGNGYEDLLIWTEAGWLRVYLNNKWVFDVDGYPVCINVNVGNWEISDHPENIAGTHQIFLEDMDNDGAMDIVTNDDLWFIKIFYWGTTNWTVNYLSTSKYMCDENWYQRISSNNNSKLVYQFAVVPYSGHILDQSLIRWQWISGPETGDVTADDFELDQGMLDNPDEITSDMLDMLLESLWVLTDADVTEDLYKQNERLKQAWFDVIPVYESGITNSADVDYVEIGCLTWEDPVKIYKTYENLGDNPIDLTGVNHSGAYVNWDLVRVNVFIEAKGAFTWTFIDNILWPWLIPLSEYNEETFENFWFDSRYVENWYMSSWRISDMANNIHWDLDNARYMIDNIHMNTWNKIKFSYWLIYHNPNNVMDISIDTLTWSDFSDYLVTGTTLNGYMWHDEFPDISVQPTDGCNDSMFVFFNNGSQTHRDPRWYALKYLDLGKLMADYYAAAEEHQQYVMDGFENWITASWSANDLGSWSTNDEVIDQVQDYVFSLAGISEQINWRGMLTSDWLDLTNNPVNLMMEYVNAQSNDVANEIDKFIWSACNGSTKTLESLWLGNLKPCSWWLPVPFNQALLWEWKYHLFGCFNLDFLDSNIAKWMPVMTFPWNRWRFYWAYIPAPWIFWFPFKWSEDKFFLWANWWDYDSLFRIYLMPTMTMQLGIALCFGPYNLAWVDLWDPLGDIAWNCIVFATEMPCAKKDQWAWENAMLDVPTPYGWLNACTKQNSPCYVWENESSSPFVLWWSNENTHSFVNVIPDWSYAWWFINIEVTPQTYSPYQERSTLDMETITLKWWATVKNKIRWSTEQWLIDIIIKKWLDTQIKYIMNNLTNFKISIIFPDFQSLLGKVDVNDLAEFSNQYDTTPKERCENRWMQRNPTDQTCTKKVAQNFESESLGSVDEWSQKNLLSREQISSRSEYTNPFEELADAFNETPLVNISTKDYTVNIPLLSSEDITSYLSMSSSWINRQTEIMKEWKDFFTAIIWVCGWSTNINGIEDLQREINELNERFKDVQEYSDWSENDKEELENLQWKIDALKSLKQKYNLSALWDYKVYEWKSWGYYIKTEYREQANDTTPKTVYIFFDPGSTDLSMFTSWFTLNKTEDAGSKVKVSIEKNNDKYVNIAPSFNKDSQTIAHSCAVLFNWGTINNSLNWFMNLQANLDKLIVAVKQNMETLQQYKKFPLQLYDWIHVIDKYLWEISSLISSTFGTLSMWMETNANRFSQYVDALITITTTLETYQMILDFSKDWTESCSTCTNDNYDQFSCKLWWICEMLGIELPVIQIPPTKIPSIYLDFSELHVESDITLPNLTFNPVSVPLPELPNIPSPPDLDFSLGLDESLALGIDLLWQLMNIDFGSISLEVWDIPLIPSPPTLPELPSFIPSVEMELPLLPPAPKIPELPNSIKWAITAAKLIWKYLCIIKGKIWLVMEQNIKAKVEQITQRDYEVPYWDDFDQTLSERNSYASTNISSTRASVFSWFSALLQTNQFKDVKMKWFDISLQTYINLQFNLDDFSSWLETVVDSVNRATNYVIRKEEQGISIASEEMGRWNARLQACVNDPISIDCLGEWNSEFVEKYERRLNELAKTKELIENWADWLNETLDEIEKKKDEVQNLLAQMSWLNNSWIELNNTLTHYQTLLNGATNEIDRKNYMEMIEDVEEEIQEIQSKIAEIHERIEQLESEITELGQEYWEMLETYRELSEFYNTLSDRVQGLKDEILSMSQDVIDQVKNEIEQAWEGVDFDEIKNLEIKMNENNAKTDRQKEINKETQLDNLKNLYKDVDLNVSYVDYNSKVNKNNFEILESTLSEINAETHNKALKERSQEYLNLIAMDRSINANIDSLVQVEKEYNTVIWNYKANNSEVLEMIQDDYDKFLTAVSNDDKSLVSDNSFDVTLSAKLFDMDNNTLQALSQNDNIVKKYLDYNMSNVNWYLNALENYSAQELNMDEEVYNMDKEYLNNIKNLADKAYDIIENEQWKTDITSKKLLAQAQWWNGTPSGSNWNNGGSSNPSTIDIANYIQWNIISTKEWNFVLSNEDYTSKFQSRFVLTDINNDNKDDMILRDEHNVYIKYRWWNSEFNNTWYNGSSRIYTYHIKSYKELVNDANSEWIVKMKAWTHTLKVKLVDENWEVKNFKYVWQTFDTIKVSRSSSDIVWDKVDWYLVKMIHRVDQFNDHENLISQGNNRELFDKKYILVLPKWSQVTWTKLELEPSDWTLNNIETHIWTWDWDEIFSLMFFNEGTKTISLTISDLPRNWQYSEVYALNFDDNTYKITSSSSNQVVAWPQIIADTEWPDVDIKLYRPSIDEVVDEGTNLKWYVWTNYILQAYWEDNVALDEIWIANAIWERENEQLDINQQTWYIELSGLYFTWSQSLRYYLWWIDIDWNEYVEEITLKIEVPSIEIKDVIRWNQWLSYLNWNVFYNPLSGGNIPNIWNGYVVSILTELDQDIDSGYIQFIRNRTNDKREILTWTIDDFNISEFKVVPNQTWYYWWYFNFGDDIWLYSISGDMVAKVNPNNWKITITHWFENTVSIKLDYSSKIPVIKVMQWNNVIFRVIFTSEELINLSVPSNIISTEPLNNELFGQFDWWNALLKDNEVLLYLSPKWQIYTDKALYWEYWFEDATDSVIYTFRDSPNWTWSVKIKIKNLLEY